MSKFITINDFDALYIEDNYFYIFELKRINPVYNILEEWRPYCKDYGNYKACELIRIRCGLTSDKFRTIAYTLEDEGKISIFTFDAIKKDAFKGKFDILPCHRLYDELKKTFHECK